MTVHFVTPGKICLLHLVCIVCDGGVPEDSLLAVLQFITARLVPNLRIQSPASTATHLEVTLKDFEQFLQLPSVDKGSLWQLLCLSLCKLQSLDQFFDWFSADGRLASLSDDAATNKRTIDAKSLLGRFVRRCQIEVYRMPLDELVGLWQDFCEYRAPVPLAEEMLREHDVDDLSGFVSGSQGRIQAAMRLRSAARARMSEADVEVLLEFQLCKLQKFGIAMPQEIRSYLHRLLKSTDGHSDLVHYASFLEAWYMGDYPAAFDNLHRYYDYAARANARDRSRFAYALLNMAVLQADFDNVHDALAAVVECVTVARENKDLVCLNYSLAWLQHFRRAHHIEPDSLTQTDTDALSFLKYKSLESSMPNVSSTATLSEVGVCLARGQRPREVLVHLTEAAALNNRFDLGGVEFLQVAGQAALYRRMGVGGLALSSLRVCMHNYKQRAELEDLVRVQCQAAYATAFAGDFRHAEAMLAAATKTSQQRLKCLGVVASFQALVRLRQKVFAGDFDEAEVLIASLAAVPLEEADIKVEAALLEHEYLVRVDNLTQAHDKLERLIAAAKRPDADVLVLVRLMTAKASLFRRAGRAQKGLTLALRAAAMAREARMLHALFEAVAVLGSVLVACDSGQEAKRLLEAVVYQAGETGDGLLVGWLQVGLGDACAAMAVGIEGVQLGGANEESEGEEEHDNEAEPAHDGARRWYRLAQTSFEGVGYGVGAGDVARKMSGLEKSSQ